MDHTALHPALNIPYLNGSSFCKALSARLYTVPQQCFISKNKLCLYLQCMAKHLLSMKSREEISLCKLFGRSYLFLPFMCNVLARTNFSEVHLFVLLQDEIVKHSGMIINSNVTLCKLYSNYKSYLGS